MKWRDIPSLPALRGFEAAARTGSLSEAARELNVTHAAIAQHLRTVERHLGLSLMQREGRGMALTDMGRKLAPPLTEAFGMIANAVHDVTVADAERPLAVTLTPNFASRWLMPRLGAFWKAHPEVPLTLHPIRRSIDLAREGMDMGIRFGRGAWPGLDSEMLMPANFTVIGAPALLAGRTVLTPAEMSALPWVVETDWPEQLVWMKNIGIDIDRIHKTEVPNKELSLSAAREGYGLLVELTAHIEDDLESGRLLAMHSDCDTDLGYHIVTRPGARKPAVNTFIRWLKSVA